MRLKIEDASSDIEAVMHRTICAAYILFEIMLNWSVYDLKNRNCLKGQLWLLVVFVFRKRSGIDRLLFKCWQIINIAASQSKYYYVFLLVVPGRLSGSRFSETEK